MPITSRFASAAARAYGMFRIAAGAVVDPFFNYVTALLHGDGTNGAQNNTFLDSSTNNFTITRNGNTTQGTFSPFSQTGWSNYFDGSGDYLSVASATALNLSTGDFTIECWVYPITGIADVDGVISKRSQSTFSGGDWRIAYRSASTAFGIACGTNNTDRLTPAIALNQWNHIAFVRSSGTLSCYANGLRGDNLTWTDNLDNVSNLLIGLNAAGFDFPGYISNVRIVKGTAVYSGTTYTVPTAPLTAITNTSLLTCQANRFLDASSNNFTVTPTGDTSVQAFSPFNPTSAWSASSNGGSGYFDGSGDYLRYATNTSSAFSLGTNNFTCEAWVYPTAFSSANIIACQNQTNGSAGLSFALYLNASGQPILLAAASTGVYAVNITGTAIPLNTWTHLAVTRNGSTFTIWKNGVSDATATSTVTITQDTTAGYGGWTVGASTITAQNFTGYIADHRLVNGTAVYTTTFTPPTAPLTAITNTSLLLNYTNAGIYDNAAVGNYETVGNAQVSTSVVKYGTGSMAFDGTGDWLTAPAQQAFSFGSGDWTVEFWLYTAQTTEALLVANRSGTGATNTNWYIFKAATTNQITLYVSDGSAWQINNLTGGPSVSNSTWNHIAVCRIGSTFKIYVNGTQAATGTWSGAISATLRPLMVGSDYAGATTLNGYIDDLRITKGIARYPYNFTPPTAAFPNIGGTVTLTADPYFNYTTLLLPGNGTNGAQNNTFLDSSSNAFTITRNGNTTQGNFSPFSQTGWGNYFNGSNYLTATSNAAFGVGTGDFTIETWIYPTAAWASGGFNSILQVDGTGIYFGQNNAGFGLRQSATANIISYGTSPSLNTWTHVAIVRSGTTVTMYYNGTSVATATSSANFSAGNVWIASDATPGNYFTGYISNLRLVKGTAVYTSNFTPSTTPLTAITNTSLLTCQSNRFIDNSANAFALTANGSPSVQAFSPFAPTATWSASTNGGSGYFDGSGDYLSVADNTALQLGSSDFTWEGWFYLNSTADQTLIFSCGNTSSYAAMRLIHDSANSKLTLLMSTSGSAWAVNSAFSSTAPQNSWVHVAIVRSGTSITAYQNGVSNVSTTLSGATYAGTLHYIGARDSAGAGSYLVGYAANVRLVKGTAVYTANFTPPTAPLTAISGTSLLLSATNGAIVDATAKNDLETVGNAQISTTQSKFGGSSMYFDGTGDYLVIGNPATRPLLDFGAGDFTIEGWVYPATTATMLIVGSLADSTGKGCWWLMINGTFGGGGTIQFGYNTTALGSGTNILAGTGTLTTNTWSHIAVTRSGANIKCFVNGMQVGTTNTGIGTSAIYPVSQNILIGQSVDGGPYSMNGYIDDLRITKGIARYTSNFTPPTTAFLLQ